MRMIQKYIIGSLPLYLQVIVNNMRFLPWSSDYLEAHLINGILFVLSLITIFYLVQSFRRDLYLAYTAMVFCSLRDLLPVFDLGSKVPQIRGESYEYTVIVKCMLFAKVIIDSLALMLSLRPTSKIFSVAFFLSGNIGIFWTL